MIKLKKISTISILLLGKNTIGLYNITLALRYVTNLILFSQFCENRITYYNKLIRIILMRNEKFIIEAKKEQNLFILNLANLEKTIVVISPPSNIKHHAMALTK